MSRRYLPPNLSKCCLILASILAPGFALRAQARPPSDPVSGTWSGYIGRSEADPSSVTVELKVTPGGAVSGTVTGAKITPGDIKSGTFDAATGALKFVVVIRGADGDGGNVTFDGRVAHDSASGTMLLGGQTGVFRLTKGAAPRIASAARAVARPAAEADAAVRRGFIEVTDWITRAVEGVPADKYSYRPVSTVRTFGQVVGHIVDGSRYYCGRGAGKNVEWSDVTEKGTTTKAALMQALKQAIAECTAAHDGANQVGPLMNNVAHSSLHYGNMVTYIRMLGLVPPSS